MKSDRELTDFGVRVELFHQSPLTEPRFSFVFVHGLSGDNQDSWRSKNGYSLLQFVKDRFPRSMVLSIGYPTSFVSGDHYNADLNKIAHSVRERILGVLPRGKPIHFICHSQGGLLCKILITQAEQNIAKSMNYSALLDRVASIAFFDTPHAGSVLAKGLGKTFKFFGVSNVISTQLRDLNANNTSLDNLNQKFLVHLSERGTQVLNLVSKKTIAGFKVAESKLEHSQVDTVRVNISHSKICKPENEEDEVCALLEKHFAIAGNRHDNHIATVKTCVVHFLDHHFLQMKAIANDPRSIESTVKEELVCTFRLALMAFDKLIIPMSCVIESGIAADIFQSHRHHLLNIFSSENHVDIDDYISDSTAKAGDRYIIVPNDLIKDGSLSSIPVMLRRRSSTDDILEGIKNTDIEKLQFSLRNVSTDKTLHAIRENWFEFENSEGAEFVVPPVFTRFILEGEENPTFFRVASQIINEHFFNSFLIDFDAWLVNPSHAVRHNFQFLDRRRVIDIREISMQTAFRSVIPEIHKWDLERIIQVYYSDERKQFQHEFWSKFELTLLQ